MIVKIYVGTYKKYNNGSLGGEWVNLLDYTSLEDFYKYCLELHKDEQDPELMFQDVDTDCRYIYDKMIDESQIHEDIFEFIELIEKASFDQDSIKEFIDYVGDLDPLELLESMGVNFWGNYESFEDFVRSYIEELYPSVGELPNFIEIDWERTARNLSFEDFCFVEETGDVFIM